MPALFEIRLAAVSDAALIASHRARMFQEMDLVPEPLFETYRAQCESRIRAMLETGEYIGWLASPNELPDKVVAGAGVQLRSVLPHPVAGPDMLSEANISAHFPRGLRASELVRDPSPATAGSE